MAKLYVVMEAILSDKANSLLHDIIEQKVNAKLWTVRVDPALARSVDLLVGERLAEMAVVSARAGVALTSLGDSAAQTIDESDSLTAEKAIISSLRRYLTEVFVTGLVFGS